MYNLTSDSSKRWDHPAFQGDPHGVITINNFTVSNNAPSDGIALSPDFETIFFCAVSSPVLFRVPALQLFDFSLRASDLRVEFVGYKVVRKRKVGGKETTHAFAGIQRRNGVCKVGFEN